MSDGAKRAPTKMMPDWMVRLVSIYNKSLAQAVPNSGKVKKITNVKAKLMLGWAPRSNGEAIASTAESLLRFGLIPYARPAGISGSV
jgi:hypothetical protein